MSTRTQQPVVKSSDKGFEIQSKGKFQSWSLNLDQDKTLQYLLLGLIMILGIGMRFEGLGKWSFWVDEMGTVKQDLVIFDHLSLHKPPALSNILIHFAEMKFGMNEWGGRIVPALIGIISIPVLFFLINKIFDPVTALGSVLFLTLSPWHLYFSQSARFYSALLLFYASAVFLFYLGLVRNNLWIIFSALVLLCFAVAERMLAFLFVPTVGIFLVLLWIFPSLRSIRIQKKTLIPFAVLSLLCLIAFFADRVVFFLKGNSFIQSELEDFFANPMDDPARVGMYIVLNIGLPLFVAALFAVFYFSFHKKNPAALYLSVAALFPFLFMIAVNPFMHTEDRYVFMTLPFWTTLGALVVKEISDVTKGWQKVLAVGVLLVLVSEPMGRNMLYYTVNHGDRFDWRNAFNQVHERMAAGDAVISTRDGIGTYYLGNEVESFYTVNPDQVLNYPGRVWFVIDSENRWDNPKLKEWVEGNAHLINFQYLRLPQELFLLTYLYDPHLQRSY